MKAAAAGDTVLVHYRGNLADGTEFGSTREGPPIEFTIGNGQVIPGVEAAVEGLHLGESTTTRITPDQGFGPRDDDLVLSVARREFPGEDPPSLGGRYSLSGENGEPVTVSVRRVEDEVVVVDANHPLAGRELHMELQLVGVD